MNSIPRVESYPRQVSPQQAAQLDAFCSALCSGHEENLRSGLQVLCELAATSAPQNSHWQGRWTPSPFEEGGILTLEDSRQGHHLSFCQDPKGGFASGTWSGPEQERIFGLDPDRELHISHGPQLTRLSLAPPTPPRQCPKCSQPTTLGDRYCGQCGQALCSHCGAGLEPQYRFCGQCGHPRKK